MAERNAYSPLSNETYELNGHNPFEDLPPYTSAIPENGYTNPYTSEPLPASYGGTSVAASQQDDTAAARPVLDAEAREQARKAEAEASKLGPRRRKGCWSNLSTTSKWIIFGVSFFLVFTIVLAGATSSHSHDNDPPSTSTTPNPNANATTTGR